MNARIVKDAVSCCERASFGMQYASFCIPKSRVLERPRRKRFRMRTCYFGVVRHFRGHLIIYRGNNMPSATVKVGSRHDACNTSNIGR